MIITSKNTSINSKKVPIIFKKVLFLPGTVNLDYGGGAYDTATEYLKTIDVLNVIYDPYNRTIADNERALNKYDYDTCTISNVLNVIQDKNERKAVIIHALEHLKQEGSLYITVYEGDRSGKGRCTKKDCWQENRTFKQWEEELSYFGAKRLPNKVFLIKKG